VEDTKAICLLSGDEVTPWPCPGNGELLPFTGARKAAPEPSACATQIPNLSPSPPEYVTHFPSGDQRGSEAISLFSPKRTAFRLATSMIQIWEYGRPGC
jgi:hypothetical protein